MARKKLKSATDQRKFTLVYNDFLDSDLLDKHEKLIYIAIKRFADNDTMRAFPSLKTLHRMTGISIRWIKKSIEHMEQIGVISVEHREDDEKGHQSNLYTLYDYAEIWSVGSSEEIEDIKKAKFVNLKEVSTELILKELERRTKEKELETSQADQSKNDVPSTNDSLLNLYKYITDNAKSQELERYSLEQIKEHFDYNIMVHDNPYKQKSIDMIMNILYDALNTSKKTIRVSGEDKPAMVVQSKLMKLDNSCIMYAIEKFSENTDRVKNPVAYMLTILYKAQEQYDLDIQNQVSHDMANWNIPTDDEE